MRFLREHRLAVQASNGPAGPQSAVVGVAFTDALEVVFDTLGSSRKAVNLRHDPQISLVVGGLDPADPRTAQLVGVADEPSGAERDRIRDAYFRVYPDGRDRLAWPGLTHFRVRLRWVRFSDYTRDPPRIVELADLP